MKTIKKALVETIELKRKNWIAISERTESWVVGILENGERLRVDTSYHSDEFGVLENEIYIAPQIVLNNGEEKFIYTDFQEALVDYTRVLGQLNNPNVEYINF